MVCNSYCALALSGAGLALSLAAARRVAILKNWLPSWLGFLMLGLTLGLTAGTALMQWLGYRW